MFSSLFGGGEEEQGTDEEQRRVGASNARSSGLDLWGIANSLGNTVKASTEELLKSVQQTDWEAELRAFSKEAAEDAKALSHLTEGEKQQWQQERQEQHQQQMMQRSRPTPGAQQQQQASTSDRSSHQHGLHHHHQLEEVGEQLRSFGQSLLLGTKEIIDQVRDAVESEIAVAARETKRSGRAGRSRLGATPAGHATSASAKYNRFEAEVAAMQHDSSTYCDEPADVEDYKQWLAGFDIQAAQPNIDKVLADNAFLAELQSRIVPAIVERDDFWTRYFYRLHKLEVKEQARQRLAQRARAASAADDSNTDGWDDGGDSGGWGAWGTAGEASKQDDATPEQGDAAGDPSKQEHATPKQGDAARDPSKQDEATPKQGDAASKQESPASKQGGSPKHAGQQSPAEKGQGPPPPPPQQQQQQQRRRRQAVAEKAMEPPGQPQQQEQHPQEQQEQQQQLPLQEPQLEVDEKHGAREMAEVECPSHQSRQQQGQQRQEQQQQEQAQQHTQEQQEEQHQEEQQQQSTPKTGPSAQPPSFQESAQASASSEGPQKQQQEAATAAGGGGAGEGKEGSQEGRMGAESCGQEIKETEPSASAVLQEQSHSSSNSSRTEWLVVAGDAGVKGGGNKSDVDEAAPGAEGMLLEGEKEGWEKEGDGVAVGVGDLPEEDAEDPWQEEVAGLEEEKGGNEGGTPGGGSKKKEGKKEEKGGLLAGDEDEAWGDWD